MHQPYTLEEAKSTVGKGWGNLIEICYNMCVEHNVQIQQIKEKFGSLRFYVDHAPDEVYNVISKAEDLSCITCEQCGEEGKISGKSWLKCLCVNCRKKEK